jgi:hypothetical protein
LIRSGDGGASWTPVSVLASRARAIELSRDGGDVYILDDDGVGQVAGRARTPIFAGRAYAAVRCGDDLLILADDGVYAWRWETGVEKRSDRLPARRLACSAEVPGLVLAVGAALLVSRDGGRRWRARDDLDLPAINDAAATADAVWIATAAGLYTLPLDAAAARGGGAGDRANREAGRSLPPALDDARVRGGAGFWRALLPRVSFVLAMVDSQPGTSRTAVWLLLTFPLDRSPVGPAQRAAALERDRLRRRAAVAAELARLRGGAAGAGPRPNDDNGDNDNDSDDERAATQRALRASWEGLR